jgi:hypothetical protein
VSKQPFAQEDNIEKNIVALGHLNGNIDNRLTGLEPRIAELLP